MVLVSSCLPTNLNHFVSVPGSSPVQGHQPRPRSVCSVRPPPYSLESRQIADMRGIARRASSTLSGFSFPSLARLRLLRGWLWCLLRPTYRCRSSPHRNSGVRLCFTTPCRPAASLLRWMTATTIRRKGRTRKAILIRAA